MEVFQFLFPWVKLVTTILLVGQLLPCSVSVVFTFFPHGGSLPFQVRLQEELSSLPDFVRVALPSFQEYVSLVLVHLTLASILTKAPDMVGDRQM